MVTRRRLIVSGASLGLMGPSAWISAQNAEFPNRPIKIVVPFAAGGGGDVIARIVSQKLSTRVSQSVIVENRTGAGGTVGSAYVLKSPPDGYTLLNMSVTYAIQAAISELSFDPVLDMQPIIMMAQTPLVLLVNNTSPFQNAQDLVRAAKLKPEMYTHGSAGVGSIAHLSVEELAYLAGVRLMHVPYKGSSQAMNDLLGGTLDLVMSSGAFVAPYVKSGRARALGIAGQKRLAILPDVPTFEEQGIANFNVFDNKSIGGPRGIPAEIVEYLNKNIYETLMEPSVFDRLASEGTFVVGGSPQDMMKHVVADIERWKNIVKNAGIKIQ